MARADASQGSPEVAARLAGFERALERAALGAIRAIAAEAMRDNPRVALQSDDPVADGVAMPFSNDVLFLVKLPVLVPVGDASEPVRVPRYSERVVDALIDTMVAQASALDVRAGGRLVVVALAAPDGGRPLRVARVYLTLTGEDLDAVIRGGLSRDEARRRVRIAHEPAVLSPR